jgi:hypothetical protein
MDPSSPLSKVLLVADRRSQPQIPGGAAAVRRYRLARLRVDASPAGPRARLEHLPRIYD